MTRSKQPSAASVFLRTVLARAYPRVVGLAREPTWIAQETLMPLLSMCALIFVYRAMGAPPEYLGFVILGGAMTAFWLNVLWSMGAQLYWERDSGNLELYIMAPGSMMAVLAGMALGGVLLTILRASVIVLAGALLFQVPFAPSSWWVLLGLFLLTMLALYGLGMVFASAFLLWGREAWHLVNLLQEPVYLVSGLNFPVRTLGVAAASLAAVIPMTTGIDAMRQVLYPSSAALGLFPVWVEVLILTVLTVLYLTLARVSLRVMEHKARVEGSLTLKWQ